MKNNISLSKTQYLLIYLFTYSFIGWLLESAYSVYELGMFTKRGFLYGPICPIYGWCAIILILFLNNYKNNSIKLFFISSIIFSAFEYCVGFGLEAIFSAKWWDYSTEFFNLNGRISILFSFVWGIFAIIFINHIHPFIKSKLDKILNKIPYIIQIIFIRIFTILFITDTVISIVQNLL